MLCCKAGSKTSRSSIPPCRRSLSHSACAASWREAETSSQTQNQWKQCRAGVPLHAVFPSELAPERLQAALAALASAPLVGATLPDGVSELPAVSLSGILSALARSAPNLAALHGVPILERPDGPMAGLGALTQLRALTLRQTADSRHEELLASQLPASVQELILVGVPFDEEDPPNGTAFSPALINFHRLHNLQRLTFADQQSWHLHVVDVEAVGEVDPVHLPPGLQVCPAMPTSS